MEKKSILMLEIFSRRFPIVNMLNIVKMLRKSSNFRYPNGKETLRLRKNYSLVLYASCFQVRSYKKISYSWRLDRWVHAAHINDQNL